MDGTIKGRQEKEKKTQLSQLTDQDTSHRNLFLQHKNIRKQQTNSSSLRYFFTKATKTNQSTS